MHLQELTYCQNRTLFGRNVPRKPRPLTWGEGHNINGNCLTGKPRPLGRGASQAVLLIRESNQVR